jgi:hypothetical protein
MLRTLPALCSSAVFFWVGGFRNTASVHNKVIWHLSRIFHLCKKKRLLILCTALADRTSVMTIQCVLWNTIIVLLFRWHPRCKGLNDVYWWLIIVVFGKRNHFLVLEVKTGCCPRRGCAASCCRGRCRVRPDAEHQNASKRTVDIMMTWAIYLRRNSVICYPTHGRLSFVRWRIIFVGLQMRPAYCHPSMPRIFKWLLEYWKNFWTPVLHHWNLNFM